MKTEAELEGCDHCQGTPAAREAGRSLHWGLRKETHHCSHLDLEPQPPNWESRRANLSPMLQQSMPRHQ